MRIAPFFLLLCAVANAQQATVDVRTAYVLNGESEQVGGLLVVKPDDELSVESVGLVTVDVPNATDNCNVMIEISDRNRLPGEIEQPDRFTAIIKTPGQWWVDVTVVDWDAKIFYRKTSFVEVQKGGITPGGGIDVPEPSEELKRLIEPMRKKLADDPDKAALIAPVFLGFSQSIFGATGRRITDTGVFAKINTAAMKDIDLRSGVSVGEELFEAIRVYVGIDKNSDGWEVRTLTDADRKKIAEVYQAAAWAGVQ